jgi:hypothetical protein
MKNSVVIIALLVVGLLVIAGCTQASSVPSLPSAPSGGGCGIAAPATETPAAADAAALIDASQAL